MAAPLFMYQAVIQIFSRHKKKSPQKILRAVHSKMAYELLLGSFRSLGGFGSRSSTLSRDGSLNWLRCFSSSRSRSRSCFFRFFLAAGGESYGKSKYHRQCQQFFHVMTSFFELTIERKSAWL